MFASDGLFVSFLDKTLHVGQYQTVVAGVALAFTAIKNPDGVASNLAGETGPGRRVAALRDRILPAPRRHVGGRAGPGARLRRGRGRSHAGQPGLRAPWVSRGCTRSTTSATGSTTSTRRSTAPSAPSASGRSWSTGTSRFESFTLADGTEITDPAYFDHSAAFAAWGPIVLELGQVHTVDPALAAAYGIRTGGVGHVSWVVDDLAAETRAARGARLPADPHRVARARSTSPGTRAARCSRTRSRCTWPGRRSSACTGRLAALAEGWDGTDLLRPMAAPLTATEEPA